MSDFLSSKSCLPCQGGIPALTIKEAQKLLAELGNEWSINDKGHLYKAYKFSNFMEAMTFANKIAILAEKEAHHPNILIAWGVCEIEIWTHKINGLTESDFILAAKIQTLV